MNQISKIPHTLLIAGNNDRKKFDTFKLIELAANICFFGLAQPPTVRPVGGKYEIVAGERRIRAMRDILGRTEITVIVREMSDSEASAIMAAENMARQDLNPIEEAQAFQKRLGQGLDVSDIAAQVGRSVTFISKRLKLLTLPCEIQHLVSVGQLGLGHAEILNNLDTNRQRIALRYFNQNRQITISGFRDYVAQLEKQQYVEIQNASVLFDMTEFEEAAPEKLVLRGKQAVTGSPINTDLPPVRMDSSFSSIFANYIADLLASGHRNEASALGNVYTAMVSKGFTSIPTINPLSETTETAGQLAHIAQK